MPWQSVPWRRACPPARKGDTLAVAEVKLLEKQTSPPDYLTEAELITLMESMASVGPARGPSTPAQGPAVAHRAGRAAGDPG